MFRLEAAYHLTSELSRLQDFKVSRPLHNAFPVIVQYVVKVERRKLFSLVCLQKLRLKELGESGKLRFAVLGREPPSSAKL